jgi:hypothetical protein
LIWLPACNSTSSMDLTKVFTLIGFPSTNQAGVALGESQ